MKLHQVLLAMRHFRKNGFNPHRFNGQCVRVAMKNSIVAGEIGYIGDCMCPLTYLMWVKCGLYYQNADFMQGQTRLNLGTIKIAGVPQPHPIAGMIAAAADGYLGNGKTDYSKMLNRTRKIMVRIFK